MRAALMVHVRGGRVLRVVAWLLVVLAAVVFGVYLVYGVVAAQLAGAAAVLLLLLTGRLVRWILHSGAD